MKILHLLSQHQLTGAEVYAMTLAKQQAQRGDVVYGVSDTFTVDFPGRVYLRPIGRKRWFYRLRNALWLAKLLRREGIEVVHVHSRAAAWVGYLACKLTRTSLVATVHGRQAVHTSARRFRVFGTHVIAVCEALKTHLVEELRYPAETVRVIPNGFPHSVWEGALAGSKTEIYGIESATPVWLYVGRFNAQKGEVARLLLRALEKMLSCEPPLLVCLIGGGAAPADIFEQAEQVGRGRGDLTIWVRGYEPEVKRWMQGADLVIGAGRVAIEGLLIGKPVVAFGERGYWGPISPANWEEALKTNFGDIGGPAWPSPESLSQNMQGWLAETPFPLPPAITGRLRQYYDLERVEAAIRTVYEESLAAVLPPIPVLCYHRVVEKPLSGRLAGLGVPIERFALQLTALHRWGYTSITFEDLLAYLKGSRPLPPRPIILTFDDGYEDNYTLAFPLLQRYGMRAVIFAVADLARRWNFWDPDGERAPLLSPAQIREMAAAGIEFGSHTLSHPYLPQMEGARLRQELIGSRQRLEDLLGKAVVSFAYPYGAYSTAVRTAVQEAGYAFAVANDIGVPFLKDPWAIARVQVFPWTGYWGFYKKTRSWYLRYKRWKKG
jgi:peptidoglycan/xylan/chitin deacetylase (PgdA/CDA1 family)/glycosyltransferase involved in cell wall biosynthesis